MTDGTVPQQYTASGTYTLTSVTLTLNTTSSDFACEGPEVGLPDVFTVVSLTETVATLGTNDIFPAGTEAYKIIKKAYWTQTLATGEWKKSGIVDGNNVLVAYTLPVDTNSVNVHAVVYPWVIADIANYPTK